ncbi:hypothetical protein PoB_000598500 [Plakobranchus ocellatus]|uniref:Uncharacterized protein n=1 Tax=Plakobranchus ocellatus TaxID=259542 RepID=A0AAV3YAD6_9GAST|nr:hypothetical protein PoB_000598500 [Plakobranchus ocellatus]
MSGWSECCLWVRVGMGESEHMKGIDFYFCIQPVHNKVISGFQALWKGRRWPGSNRNRRAPDDFSADSLSTVLLERHVRDEQIEEYS